MKSADGIYSCSPSLIALDSILTSESKPPTSVDARTDQVADALRAPKSNALDSTIENLTGRVVLQKDKQNPEKESVQAFNPDWDLITTQILCGEIDINAKVYSYYSAKGVNLFWLAAHYKKWDLVRLMIERYPQVDINSSPAEGRRKDMSALWWAAGHQQWDLVHLMLEKGETPDVNTVPNKGVDKGKSVLWFAAINFQWDLVRLMLENWKNLDVNAAPAMGCRQGKSVLWCAAAAWQWNLVRLMLEVGENPDVNAAPAEGPHRGKSVLWCAAAAWEWDLVRLMFEKGGNPDVNTAPVQGTGQGKSVLWWAAAAWQWDLVRQIVEKEEYLDVNTAPAEGPSQGRNVLWWTVGTWQWDLVRLMLEKGENLNINSAPSEGFYGGMSALYWAAANLQWDLVKLMLEKGENPDVNATSVAGRGRGKSVLWWAVSRRKWDLVKLMFEKSGSSYLIDAKPDRKRSLTSLMLRSRRLDIRILRQFSFPECAIDNRVNKKVSTIIDKHIRSILYPEENSRFRCLVRELRFWFCKVAILNELNASLSIENFVPLNSWLENQICRIREKALRKQINPPSKLSITKFQQNREVNKTDEEIYQKQIEVIAKLSFRKFRCNMDVEIGFTKPQIIKIYSRIKRLLESFRKSNPDIFFDYANRQKIIEEISTLKSLDKKNVEAAIVRALLFADDETALLIPQ